MKDMKNKEKDEEWFRRHLLEVYLLYTPILPKIKKFKVAAG